MAEHPWLRSIETVALCPKCGEAALRRSHTKNRWEKMIKEYTFKRIFRCHECGWRGWLDESHLEYPAGSHKPHVQVHPGDDADIPDFELGEVQDSQQQAAGRSRKAAAQSASGTPLREQIPANQKENMVPAETHESFSRKVTEDFHALSHDKHHTCPNCREPRLYRSRHKSIAELLRKRLSSKRPYRCNKCNWRGWLP